MQVFKYLEIRHLMTTVDKTDQKVAWIYKKKENEMFHFLSL